MPFCKKAIPAVRKFLDAVTPALAEIIKEVTTVTAFIKNSGFIPVGTKTEACVWINKAIDTYTGYAETALPLAVKIGEMLDSCPTEAAKEAAIFKVAALAVKIGHSETGEPVTKQSFYDSAVQLRIIADKEAA